ncbi:head-tail connector protein [Eubacteriales bacterium OttesenSCG-928-N13]|nr:head-tail connector protein [Eubacteriales bacterium OttesenSCG-928-N13]
MQAGWHTTLTMSLSLDAVKTHLRIQHDEEDEYLKGLVRQAQAAAEDFCRVSLEENTPEPAVLAMLLMIGHYYENRDNPDKQAYIAMRMAFESLLYPHRDEAKMF